MSTEHLTDERLTLEQELIALSQTRGWKHLMARLLVEYQQATDNLINGTEDCSPYKLENQRGYCKGLAWVYHNLMQGQINAASHSQTNWPKPEDDSAPDNRVDAEGEP